MPTINIYFNNENYSKLQSVDNKGGLINQLLDNHFNQISKLNPVQIKQMVEIKEKEIEKLEEKKTEVEAEIEKQELTEAEIEEAKIKKNEELKQNIKNRAKARIMKFWEINEENAENLANSFITQNTYGSVFDYMESLDFPDKRLEIKEENVSEQNE